MISGMIENLIAGAVCKFIVEQSERPSFARFPYVCTAESQLLVQWHHDWIMQGILHPLNPFEHVHRLLNRGLTRKGPHILPHPHVDFKQPAPVLPVLLLGLDLKQLRLGSYP
jgi:hypothetical protein